MHDTPKNKVESFIDIVDVPPQYKPIENFSYPPHQDSEGMEFIAEEYCRNAGVCIDRKFLPVRWTSYQVNANYGNDKKKMDDLKKYCKSLPGDSGYFTVVQYADGILVDIPNCVVFSAGGIGDVPIPLSTKKHVVSGYSKEYLASFIGSLKTHSMRQDLKGIASNNIIVEHSQASKDNISNFVEITEKSSFILCPRGYGVTSFRLYEAMQLGSVPVYISDIHWLPFTQYVDWTKFCVILRPNEIKNIPSVLKGIIDRGEYSTMKEEAMRVYQDYFSLGSMFKWVIDILKN